MVLYGVAIIASRTDVDFVRTGQSCGYLHPPCLLSFLLLLARGLHLLSLCVLTPWRLVALGREAPLAGAIRFGLTTARYVGCASTGCCTMVPCTVLRDAFSVTSPLSWVADDWSSLCASMAACCGLIGTVCGRRDGADCVSGRTR